MYQQFIFEDYHFDAPTSTAYFNYSLDDKIYFEEKIIFPSGECSKSFEKALFGAWVMAGISYFKTYLPEKIIFKKGGLNQEQADFFTHVYTQGLGEFFYQNKINKPTEKIKFPVLLPNLALGSNSLFLRFPDFLSHQKRKLATAS